MVDTTSDRVKPRNGYNKGSQQKYYSKNKDWILQKKKVYALKNKERIAEYHKNYYLIHKEELNRKHREYLRNRKNNKRVKHKVEMTLNFGFNYQSYCV